MSIVQGTVHGLLPQINYQHSDDVIQAQRVSDHSKGYSLETSDTFLLLLVCYEFKAQRDFRVIGERIMREHIGSFVTLATNTELRTRGLVDIGTLYRISG